MQVRVYTDGSCSGNPGPGGWAIVFNTDTDCITASGCEYETTNNRMELTAMLRTLQRILRDGSTDNTYIVFSDSAYVVNTINNQWLPKWCLNGWQTKSGSSVKNKDLWQQVHTCLSKLSAQGFDVTLQKVKGHAGITFNELVDKLAREESEKAKQRIKI